jgi:hypothetical protein
MVAATKIFRALSMFYYSLRFVIRQVLSFLDTIWPHEYGVNPTAGFEIPNWHTKSPAEAHQEQFLRVRI